MHLSFAKSCTAIVLSLSLWIGGIAQQPGSDETRPRRIHTTEPGSVEPGWRVPEPQSIVSLDALRSSASGSEPLIRVALSTNARSGSISSNSLLLNATGVASTFVALNTNRIRVEPRLLSPLPPTSTGDSWQIRIGGIASRQEAEEKSRELRKELDAKPQITFEVQTAAWGLILPAGDSQEETQDLIERLNDAGYDASLVTTANTQTTSRVASTIQGQNAGNLRLAARVTTPSREVVGFGSSAAPLLNSSAPVVFANVDKTPLRFNERPYRGQIEVFANTRGTLTVVNVLGLEDYVRGVVANELSPGSYPALEALKAQAIAARTYALRNRGQFMAQGFDLLPTTRSQVYRGLASENPLASRAVDETRGIVATYNGEPINALYTSTCGGRTEDSENIFNEAVAYLRGRECATEGQDALAPFKIQSLRDVPDLREEKHVPLARDTALLVTQNFPIQRSKLSDSWLAGEASVADVRLWLASVGRIARQVAPTVTEDVNRPGPFATALVNAVHGENRADVLLNNADVEYFLAIRDAGDIPVNNRADVSALVKDGHMSVFPDTTLRPREPMSRARVLHTIARMLEARGLFQLQKGTTRPTAHGEMILRVGRNKDLAIKVSPNAFLFRQIADGLYPVRSVILVGGETVVYHVGPTSEIDYLEVGPSRDGAAAERFSPFTNWTTELSLGQVRGRLARAARGIGTLVDLRVSKRGSSRRAIDLELVGTEGSAHLRGGRIRSALGLREQLFVIDKKYDEAGRVTGFTFSGRGWGHGVGMCQVGAYGLARQGLSYTQILKAYYTGIEVSRIYR